MPRRRRSLASIWVCAPGGSPAGELPQAENTTSSSESGIKRPLVYLRLAAAPRGRGTPQPGSSPTVPLHPPSANQRTMWALLQAVDLGRFSGSPADFSIFGVAAIQYISDWSVQAPGAGFTAILNCDAPVPTCAVEDLVLANVVFELFQVLR